MNTMNNRNENMAPAMQPVHLNIAEPAQKQKESSGGGLFSTIRGKNKKKISKAEISYPTGFRVVQHVGLTSGKNFEV